MVKKRTLCALAAALAAAVGWGLAAREDAPLAASAMAFPGVRPSPFATLLARGATVTVVYADRDTTSLCAAAVPAVGALPAVAPPPAFVDKVDIVPPLGASFGLHAAAAVDGRLALLYVDRERDDRLLLKRVTEDAAGWRLQLVEPFGLPVAVIGATDAKPIDVWAPGALMARDPSGDRRLRASVEPRGQGAAVDAAGSPGSGVWDDASQSLLLVRASSGGLQAFTVPGAGPVHAIAESPDGTLAVATYDAAARRILLLERKPGATSFRRTTVTICDGTNGLYLSWTPAGWRFVYDEVRPAPLGRWTWQVCLLEPEPRAVGRPRYRRLVLSSDPREIMGLRALIAGGSLFVLEMREGLRLLKAALP